MFEYIAFRNKYFVEGTDKQLTINKLTIFKNTKTCIVELFCLKLN